MAGKGKKDPGILKVQFTVFDTRGLPIIQVDFLPDEFTSEGKIVGVLRSIADKFDGKKKQKIDLAAREHSLKAKAIKSTRRGKI